MSENAGIIQMMLIDLCDSSSSESDEELINEVVQLEFNEKTKRPKIENYLDVVYEYNEKEFRRNFRVSKGMFQKIKELYEGSEFHCKNLHGLPSISTDTRVLLFLWFVGNKCVIRDVASRFGVAESTCHKICETMIDFLLAVGKTVIRFPRTDEEKSTVAAKFEMINGFPGIIGAVDGSYIQIRAPAHKIRSTYINRHDQISLTLQGICDADRKFLDVFTGVPSKSHDSYIFKKSFISNDLTNICGNDWHVIADSAYPCKKWMFVPYKDYGNLTPSHQNYNRKLSQCRVRIENSFGILKGRFRQLQKTEFNTVLKTSKFIIACCVLHNLCIIDCDEWDGELSEDDNNINNNDHLISSSTVSENQEKSEGQIKRDNVRERLWNNN